jgi:hypothetical protein
MSEQEQVFSNEIVEGRVLPYDDEVQHDADDEVQEEEEEQEQEPRPPEERIPPPSPSTRVRSPRNDFMVRDYVRRVLRCPQCQGNHRKGSVRCNVAFLAKHDSFGTLSTEDQLQLSLRRYLDRDEYRYFVHNLDVPRQWRKVPAWIFDVCTQPMEARQLFYRRVCLHRPAVYAAYRFLQRYSGGVPLQARDVQSYIRHLPVTLLQPQGEEVEEQVESIVIDLTLMDNVLLMVDLDQEDDDGDEGLRQAHAQDAQDQGDKEDEDQEDDWDGGLATDKCLPVGYEYESKYFQRFPERRFAPCACAFCLEDQGLLQKDPLTWTKEEQKFHDQFLLRHDFYEDDDGKTYWYPLPTRKRRIKQELEEGNLEEPGRKRNKIQDKVTCAVCMASIDDGHVVWMPCKHQFCSKPCMREYLRWQAANKKTPTCPLCRSICTGFQACNATTVQEFAAVLRSSLF